MEKIETIKPKKPKYNIPKTGSIKIKSSPIPHSYHTTEIKQMPL